MIFSGHRKVRIVPKSSRAKNRVQEHGEIMLLIKEDSAKFFVESTTHKSEKDRWFGWFFKESGDHYEEIPRT
jgi:hypothetical protein